MILTSAARTALINHLLANADWANIGDATGLRGSTVPGSFYMSLHTADPGDAGAQNTTEAAYGSYARQPITRAGGSWSVLSGVASNANHIDFPQATSGSEVLTHWGLGTDLSGAGNLITKGPLIASGALFVAGVAVVSDTLTIPGHGLSVNDRVSFYQVANIALPTGITEGVVYWVKTVSGDDITISTSQGGATLDVTASGAFLAIEHQPISVSAPIQPQVSIGSLSIAFY
jgi:hypothetical protein